MQKLHLILFCAFAALLTAGCAAVTTTAAPAPTAVPTAAVPATAAPTLAPQPLKTTAAQMTPIPYPPEIQSALERMAGEINQPITALKVELVEAVDWPDSCLGLPNPSEACAMMITPGYRVRVSVGSQLYDLHTDRSGRNYRWVTSR